jgi:hypothetical protein
MLKTARLLTATALSVAVIVPLAQAGDEWDVKVDLQGSYGDYAKSTEREDLWSAGLIVTADYLDNVGFTVGYNKTEVNYTPGTPKLTQDALFASVRFHDTPDLLPGRLTYRLDGHLIENDDPTGNTDEGRILAPQIAYLAFDKSLYLDLGYAHSSYAGDLTLTQWTPTLGIGLNQGNDWLQLRGYLIHSSNASRTQGKEDTSAVEAKLTHYFGSDAPLGIDRLQATLLGGQRMYAVDGDAGAVYNLADIQKGSLSLGGAWDLDDSWSVLLVGGLEKYENQDISDEYDNRYLYFDVNRKW